MVVGKYYLTYSQRTGTHFGGDIEVFEYIENQIGLLMVLAFPNLNYYTMRKVFEYNMYKAPYARTVATQGIGDYAYELEDHEILEWIVPMNL